MNINKTLICMALSACVIVGAVAQTRTNKKGSKYQFTVEKELTCTDVKNQFKSNTCWSFSTHSFLESELTRMGKEPVDLSEMFVVRKMYSQKADRYLRMMGKVNFAAGGEPHDVMNAIKEYGLMPRSIYMGTAGKDKPEHLEMDAVLRAMMDAALKMPNGSISPFFKPSFEGAIDGYLGKAPEKFDYKGKSYTPLEFSKHLGINPDDYVEISSFSHHPFYSKFILEVPDNWAAGEVYNVPLDDFKKIAENAVLNGYSIAWASDVSESGFSFKNGIALVPAKEQSEMSKDEKDSLFLKPVTEKEITQANRQDAFDNLQTQDDHGMHITGAVKDQNGNRYFIVKNSWGKDNDCGGFFYCSMPYFLYKTTAIMVHKSAIPKEIANKMGLK